MESGRKSFHRSRNGLHDRSFNGGGAKSSDHLVQMQRWDTFEQKNVCSKNLYFRSTPFFFSRYPTFARTVPAETKITQSFMALLKHFKWKKFSVIFEDHESSTDLLKSIKQAIEVENQNSGKNEGYTIMNTSLIMHFSEVSVSSVRQLSVNKF